MVLLKGIKIFNHWLKAEYFKSLTLLCVRTRHKACEHPIPSSTPVPVISYQIPHTHLLLWFALFMPPPPCNLGGAVITTQLPHCLPTELSIQYTSSLKLPALLQLCLQHFISHYTADSQPCSSSRQADSLYSLPTHDRHTCALLPAVRLR